MKTVSVKKLLLFCVAVLLVGGAAVRGQSALDGFDLQANNQVYVVAVQSDGKILVTGEIYDPTFLDPFGSHEDHYYFAMVRLNSDGSVDSTFGNSGMMKIEQAGVGDAVVLGSGFPAGKVTDFWFELSGG